MKIVVTADGLSLAAQTNPRFGRCPVYIFVDSETLAFEAIENPAAAASGGAGIQAAQFVIERGAQAVVTGSTGPNAFQVFQSAGVPIYLGQGGTVREAVEAYRAGRLQAVGGANAPAHAGMGMGRGMGRGVGRGMGRGMNMDNTIPPTIATAAPAIVPKSSDGEIAALKDTASDLRKQLAELIDRIDQLEKPE